MQYLFLDQLQHCGKASGNVIYRLDDVHLYHHIVVWLSGAAI